MKAKKIMSLILVGIICWGASCENPPGAKVVYSITLKDESGSGFLFTTGYTYPDTLIPSNYGKLKGCPSNSVVRYDSKKDWDEVFKGLPSDTLSIFIFTDIVTLDNWSHVQDNYEVTIRYDLSFQDLDRLKWLVVYPPDDRMSGIKMYPQ